MQEEVERFDDEYPEEAKFMQELIREGKGHLVKVEKPGRNEPCPCNSGKKFKKCCLKKWGY